MRTIRRTIRRNDDEVPVLEAIIDSTAHGAYPRAGLLFSRKSDEPEKGLITLAKHNLSPPMPPLVYRVDAVDHEQVGRQPKLVIEGPSSELASRPTMTLTQELRAWVRQWIDRSGWVPAELLFEFGEPYGYSKWQIRRALKGIGARPTKIGFGRRSWTRWELPDLAKKRDEDRKARLKVIEVLLHEGGLFRESREPVTLAMIIAEVRRRGRAASRQMIREVVRNMLYRRVDEDGSAVYAVDPKPGDTCAGQLLSNADIRQLKEIAKGAARDVAPGRFTALGRR